MQVSGERMKCATSILHGENLRWAEKVRRHANFAENVPIAIIVLAIVEFNGAAPVVVHALGSTLVGARIMHPFGIRHDVIPHPMRAAGAGLTFLVSLTASMLAGWQFLIEDAVEMTAVRHTTGLPEHAWTTSCVNYGREPACARAAFATFTCAPP